MEEIKLGIPLNETSIGLGLFQELMERSKEAGVQVGVPWTGAVYRYLFEEGTQTQVDEIFSNLCVEDITEDNFL